MKQIVYNNLKIVPCAGGGIMAIEKRNTRKLEKVKKMRSKSKFDNG